MTVVQPGKFITFEGIDGAGKSTHIERFAQQLRGRRIDVVVSREPGGTPVAESLRGLLLSEQMRPETEVLLAFAARNEHVKNVIVPALKQGQWVVCDRFTDSTYAYQGGGRGVERSVIAGLAQMVLGEFEPDLTILFDLPADEAAARRGRARQADRFEALDQAFFERVRQAYLARIQERPSRYVLIDARQGICEIKEKLAKISATI